MFRWLKRQGKVSQPSPPAITTQNQSLDPFSEARLIQLLGLVTADAQPNLNALRSFVNNIEPLSLTVKQMGYRLARQLADALPVPVHTEAHHVGLKSSLSTQAAIESTWVAHWCRELGNAVLYHRKVWELCYVLQALFESEMLQAGRRGVGFGCGTEPIASYLAAQEIDVVATDLPPELAAQQGWVSTNQHASAPESAFMPHLVSKDTYDKRVSLRYLDMNEIPGDLTGYDFCWSICALEHLGSIANGLNFIENSLHTIKPGGIAVHTTEFNIRDTGPTIDNWPTVAFQRKHLEELAARLTDQGHDVAAFDFSLGDQPLDGFIDVPPYQHDLTPEWEAWLGPSHHLKLTLDGLIVTCVGLIITKGE